MNLVENGNLSLNKLIVYLLYAIAFFMPLLPDIGSIIIFIAFILAVIDAFKNNSKNYFNSPAKMWFGGLIILSALSIFNSKIPFFSAFNWLYTMGSYAMIYFMTFHYMNTEIKQKQLFKVILISAIISCLYGLVQFSQIYGIAGSEWVDPSKFPLLKRRLYSTLQNPNLMGAYLLFVLALTVPLAVLIRKLRHNFKFYLVLLLFLICEVLTYSRGIWISCMSMVVYWGVFFRRKFLLSLLSIPLIMFFYHGGVANRLWSLFGHQDTSVSLRYALWDSTTYMIAEYPFLGIGWGSYWATYPEYNYFIQDNTIIYHAHNMFLHLMAVIGIPGAICFVVVLLIHAYQAFKLPTDNNLLTSVTKYALPAMILGIFISGMSDYELYSSQVSNIFWQIMGLGAAVIKNNMHKSEV